MFFFEISGPEFLGWYSILFAVSLLAAFVFRQSLMQISTDKIPNAEIEQYEIAYLNGGSKQVFFSAVATLTQFESVDLDTVARKLKLREGAPLDKLHPVEQDLCKAIKWSSNATIDVLCSSFSATTDRVCKRLRLLGLVPSFERGCAASLGSASIVLLLPAGLGLPRLVMGIHNGRPVGFLVMLLALSVCVACGLIMKQPHRTSLGDAVLKKLQSDNAALKTTFSRHRPSMQISDVALTFALFGGTAATVMSSAFHPYNAARAAMNPPVTTGSHGGIASCGGGGCGGGCGGCGGCGG